MVSTVRTRLQLRTIDSCAMRLISAQCPTYYNEDEGSTFCPEGEAYGAVNMDVGLVLKDWSVDVTEMSRLTTRLRGGLKVSLNGGLVPIACSSVFSMHICATFLCAGVGNT